MTTYSSRSLRYAAMVFALTGCTAGPSEEEIAAQDVARNQVVTEQYHAVRSRKLTMMADSFMPEMVTGMPIPHEPVPAKPGVNDQFERVDSQVVKQVSNAPVSTFSADVDTASYSYVRKTLNAGLLPPEDAVRLEEMVNYFDYQYPEPVSAASPFLPTVVVQDSPWAEHRKLIHIGVQGYALTQSEQPNSNLVFLLDVSGSMQAPDKLPLVQQSIKLLLNNLKPTDKISIVVYAGASGTVLAPTLVSDSEAIFAALDNLKAGGSTAGGEGLNLAYRLAESNYDETAVNRIILATDGDFNVGLTDREQLKDFVARKRESGIFLSVVGFGRGNYNDALMQSLAQHGNGIAAYIDTLAEARKVFVEEATSSLFPIANDLKLQIEFNPAVVREYRLLGYETRTLQREDFNNDKVDAGDVGSGHSVTAIYEITMVGRPGAFVDDLRYAVNQELDNSVLDSELGYLKLRYKLPGEDTSRLLEQPIMMHSDASETLQREIQFAASVAGFAQLLKNDKYTGDWTLDDALNLAVANKGLDYYGYRSELTQLIRLAMTAEQAEF